MFVASAVDHVGNRQPLDLNKAITVDFELQKRKFVCKKIVAKITKYDFSCKLCPNKIEAVSDRTNIRLGNPCIFLKLHDNIRFGPRAIA